MILSSYNRVIRKYSSYYIPRHENVSDLDVNKLYKFINENKKNLVVLTGAGISTESGIPDYRSKDVGLYARTNHKPITYQEFMKYDYFRKRYWARSYVGWPIFSAAQPNIAHKVLSALEKHKHISTIVTQNVDSLHFKAGCQNIIELHGTLSKVICTSCSNEFIDRDIFQTTLKKLNPCMIETTKILRPDGDVELNSDDINSFNVPNCTSCNGYMKPDVVFFGENVPPHRVETVKNEMHRGSALLVLGSSLTVYSAYRIVLQAASETKPICIVNIGDSRGDYLANLKINARCGEILQKVYNKYNLN